MSGSLAELGAERNREPSTQAPEEDPGDSGISYFNLHLKFSKVKNMLRKIILAADRKCGETEIPNVEKIQVQY